VAGRRAAPARARAQPQPRRARRAAAARSLFVRLQADHLLREPLDAARSAGFCVRLLERSRLGVMERLVAIH
jgi:hypothetical protein